MPFIDRKDTFDNRSLDQRGRNIDLEYSDLFISLINNSGWSQVLGVMMI